MAQQTDPRLPAARGPRAGIGTGRQRNTLVNQASKAATGAREGGAFQPQPVRPTLARGAARSLSGTAIERAVEQSLGMGGRAVSQFVFGRDRPPSVMEMLGAIGPVVPGAALPSAAAQAPRASRTLFGALSRGAGARQAFSSIRSAQASKALGTGRIPIPQTLPIQQAQRFVLPGMQRVRGATSVGLKSVDEFDALKQNIAQRGFDQPVEFIYDPVTGKGMLSDGAHRLLAAGELGMKDIPIRVVGPLEGMPVRHPFGQHFSNPEQIMGRFNAEAISGMKDLFRSASRRMGPGGGGIAPPPGYRPPKWLQVKVRGNRL